MKIFDTHIPGVVVIEPNVFTDRRGYFFESFSQKQFDQLVRPTTFVQDNQSHSCFGVIRGLHFQLPPYAQSKLVRVVQGRILDVAVDIRRHSPTYGKHVAIELSADNHRQLFIPQGFAHGFSVLSPSATLLYKCDNFYHQPSEGTIAWNDRSLAIDWQIAPDKIVVSPKDAQGVEFSSFQSPFLYT